MTTLTQSEARMWQKPHRQPRQKATDAEINEKYDRGEYRIVTEYNREKLPNFVAALQRPKYMEMRPIYQRRPRWDDKRQSRLIESFIMNIPVPPLFVYETQYNSYEVVDGQQRIMAVSNFYSNLLTLCGLERWPELNGRKYDTLPDKIRDGIDRRAISYIVLMKESAPNEEDATLLKQLVFERLNTGGVMLSKQEVRNCLYQGKFNDMVRKLGGLPQFRKAIGLPPRTDDEDKRPSEALLEIPAYKRMEDMEIVLRFFALRNVEKMTGGLQDFLDLYMLRTRDFSEQDIAALGQCFEQTMILAAETYGDVLFRPFDPRKNGWADHHQKAYCDAVLVGMARNLTQSERLVERKDRVVEATKQLFLTHERGTFTGRGNTKNDVQNRIDLIAQMLAGIAEG